MSWDHHQYKLFYFLFYTDGDLKTFTLLFYVVLFPVLYWCWSQDIYFTVLIVSVQDIGIRSISHYLQYWYYHYCPYNTGTKICTSIAYNTCSTSIVHLQYWNIRIVDVYTIPEAPVFFIQQYWPVLRPAASYYPIYFRNLSVQRSFFCNIKVYAWKGSM
jgi:hypothetical protein